MERKETHDMMRSTVGHACFLTGRAEATVERASVEKNREEASMMGGFLWNERQRC